ncbi:hypothetical protein ABZV87_37700, partial [Streptomyces tendae]
RLLLVDDAHLLDGASAALLHQLAVHGRTARPSQPPTATLPARQPVGPGAVRHPGHRQQCEPGQPLRGHTGGGSPGKAPTRRRALPVVTRTVATNAGVPNPAADERSGDVLVVNRTGATGATVDPRRGAAEDTVPRNRLAR